MRMTSTSCPILWANSIERLRELQTRGWESKYAKIVWMSNVHGSKLWDLVGERKDCLIFRLVWLGWLVGLLLP